MKLTTIFVIAFFAVLGTTYAKTDDKDVLNSADFDLLEGEDSKTEHIELEAEFEAVKVQAAEEPSASGKN